MNARRKKLPEQDVGELGNIMTQIKKQSGDEVARRAVNMPVSNHIPLGSFIFDYAMLGGIPDGYVTMMYGLESSGKTTLSKKLVASYQRKYPDRMVVWVDMEGMFDSLWARRLGCDLDRIMVLTPDTGNEAVDYIEAVMGAKEVGMVVLDSIPSCVPKKIVDKSSEDDTMAELARLMGKLCSKVLMSYSRERKRDHRVTFLMLNQFRSKVGLVFGDPRTLPGGRQINHLPTTKIEIKNSEESMKDKYGNEVHGVNVHTFKITKRKHGGSINTGEFRMVIDPDNEAGLPVGSFDDVKTVRAYGQRMGIVTGAGSSWKIPEHTDQVFRTHSEMEQYLKDNPEALLWMKTRLIGMQREAKEIPILPPDGYLLDWITDKEDS